MTQPVKTSNIAAPIAESAKRLIDFTVFIPVSYTHLRAHETVLELVCIVREEWSVGSRSEIESGWMQQRSGGSGGGRWIVELGLGDGCG
ncbi:hypothetical protein PVA38_07185 [Streptococcus pneumoniae D39]|nr:hypothetical protein PVA38_07185 [Streptococcus pneumoniae D39]